MKFVSLKCICMKVAAITICLGAWAQPSFADSAEPPNPPNLSAEVAILIEAGSGVSLYEKNADRLMYPASITKIITAVVALQNSDLNEIVTVSKEARNEEGTRVYLAEGEQLTMERLLYALLLNSGNDAATAIAEHIDGSKEKFADRMNAFVKNRVGVNHTISKNPSGLPDPEHVTTARDMAKISQFAMQNETFRTIVSTKKMPWQGKEWQSSLVNHNRLLGTYEGATGIKNGYTTEAGSTLVASAKRDGMELIGVVLKSANSKSLYEDMTRLLDYGFGRYRLKSVFTAGQSHIVTDGESKQEFEAKTPVMAAVRIEENPDVSVDRDGLILLDTEWGRQAIGRLTRVSIPTVPPAETKANEKAVPSVYPYLVFVLWLLMNLFMVFLAVLIYRKKRRKGLGRGT